MHYVQEQVVVSHGERSMFLDLFVLPDLATKNANKNNLIIKHNKSINILKAILKYHLQHLTTPIILYKNIYLKK